MNENPQSKSGSNPGRWSLGDLLDFEVLFGQDDKAGGLSADSLRRRDEKLCAEFQSQVDPGNETPPARSPLFRFWLERRRSDHFGHEPSPGEQAESLLRWLSAALLLVGFLLARGAVLSFFRAPESLLQRGEPINVFWYSIVCIGVPLLLTAGGFWWLLGVRAIPMLPRAPAFVRGALLGLMHPILARAWRKVSDVSGPEKRLAAQAFWGALRRRAMDRGGAIGLKLTSMGQLFGLGFTAGILLFSWTECMFYSRVFGWQSTHFTVTAEAAYEIVKTISFPWAWLAGEGSGFPSLDQVAATRFVRYQDPGRFPPGAAAAWANFLIAAALVYGFLPRALLYFLSQRELRRALRNPDFEQARFDRLWERLTKPRVQIRTPRESAESAPPALAHAQQPRGGAEVSCILVLPEELDSEDRREAIIEWLKSEKMWTVDGVLPLATESGGFDQALAELTRVSSERSGQRVVVIQESFMPPVKSVLKFLAQASAAMKTGGAVVGLLGKPSSHPLGEPPSKTDVAVWEAKVLGLGDSNTDVFAFREAVS